jgi:hypothetical protein
VIGAIISGSKDDTQATQEPKTIETISKEKTPHQVLPDAYNQLTGFVDMGGMGMINSWWLP